MTKQKNKILECSNLLASGTRHVLRVFVLAVFAYGIPDATGQTVEPPYASYVKSLEGYTWKFDSKRTDDKGVTGCSISLTSQIWQGAPWTHNIQLAVPAQSVAPDLAVIFVNQQPPAGLLQTAAELGVACAVVGGIYPACFGVQGGEGIARYGLEQYLKTQDPNWLLVAPTTKSLVRTMDALEACSAKEMKTPIKRYILTGFSKMGLAAWMAAAWDTRVAGIIPVGADMLNTLAIMADKPGGLGGMLGPDAAQSPNLKKALELMDPYTYRQKLIMPKLVISGSNDEHFDVSFGGLYWDGLPGPKWHLYLENASHAKEPNHPKTVAATAAFIRALAGNRTLPEIGWKGSENGEGFDFVATTSIPARNARLWVASAPRDFKFATWTELPLIGDGKVFTAHLAKAATGRVAAYAELEFGEGSNRYSLTTGVYLTE